MPFPSAPTPFPHQHHLMCATDAAAPPLCDLTRTTMPPPAAFPFGLDAGSGSLAPSCGYLQARRSSLDVLTELLGSADGIDFLQLSALASTAQQQPAPSPSPPVSPPPHINIECVKTEAGLMDDAPFCCYDGPYTRANGDERAWLHPEAADALAPLPQVQPRSHVGGGSGRAGGRSSFDLLEADLLASLGLSPHCSPDPQPSRSRSPSLSPLPSPRAASPASPSFHHHHHHQQQRQAAHQSPRARRRRAAKEPEFLKCIRELLEAGDACVQFVDKEHTLFFVVDASSLADKWSWKRSLEAKAKEDGNSIHSLLCYYTRKGKLAITKRRLGGRIKNAYSFAW